MPMIRMSIERRKRSREVREPGVWSIQVHQQHIAGPVRCATHPFGRHRTGRHRIERRLCDIMQQRAAMHALCQEEAADLFVDLAQRDPANPERHALVVEAVLVQEHDAFRRIDG